MSVQRKLQLCAFCGLPLSSSFSLGHEQDGDVIDYCCSGCRAVASVEAAEQEQGLAANHLFRLGLAIFFTMNVMVFTLALWSNDIYPEQSFENPLSITLRSVFRWASLLFSLPVLWLLGGTIAQGVWVAMRRKAITTDLLMLLGVSAAYGYSIISVLRGEGHVYFEVGSMVLVFVSLGRWLEAKGKRRTGESLDALADLLPSQVRRLDARGEFQEITRQEVATGDVLRVLPGERFPTDGRIVSGVASVDQQLVTGESLPVAKSFGEDVYGGTLNLDGDLHIEVSAADGNETVSRLIAMVRQARSIKGPQELLADRVANWFVPFVCILAISVSWYHGQTVGLDKGFLAGLAVVLIACPCALGLATPMAVWAALGRAAEGGVLFRSGKVMQELAAVRFACFDKTGTLTTGQPMISDLLVAQEQVREQLTSVAAVIAAGSTHPLSRAITQFALQQQTAGPPEATTSVETLPGRGVSGEVPGMGRVLLGSKCMMEEAELSMPPELAEKIGPMDSRPLVFVGWGGMVRGAFRCVEFTRPEVAVALETCRQLGLELFLLTGDDASRADEISARFGLTTSSKQLPGDKVAAVELLTKIGSVAMVGDGLNDAPALAAANVGVALGCGADVARDAAGVCLLADDLSRFPWAVGLARQTSRIVKQNLFWAFLYNCLGIALAATGQLNPIWAALAMAVSSLFVISNSLRLSHFPKDLSTSLGNTEDAPRTFALLREEHHPPMLPTTEMASTSL